MTDGQLPSQKLIVYNWSDYIPPDVIQDFTEETGIEVQYPSFESNEVMYAKLKLLNGRGFDIVVPSTYMVSKLRDEGFIQYIDTTRLSNFKHLNAQLLNKSFDPKNSFSIPYMWGSTGIAIDTNKHDINEASSWRDLWLIRWKGKIRLLDDMRDVFHIAFSINGHSTNTTELDELNQAYRLLSRLMPNVATISSDYESELLSDGIELAHTWNGDVFSAQEQNPGIEYIYPEEGANFWMDSFVIPSRAVNVDNAYQFIDFMLRPDIAARCVEEYGYATANRAALEILPEEIRNNPIIFPPEDIINAAEFQQDIGNMMELMLLYWNSLKTFD